jgi:hypothetical protein
LNKGSKKDYFKISAFEIAILYNKGKASRFIFDAAFPEAGKLNPAGF